MRVLDLFCGQGGAAMGYNRAGFEIIGVDHKPQPRYPFVFVHAEWDEALRYLRGVDLVHASPPCQRYTANAKQRGTHLDHPDLIAEVRHACRSLGIPYVIENVKRAMPLLDDPIMMCGVDFGLNVLRYRVFEAPWLSTEARKTKSLRSRWHGSRVRDGKYVTVAGHSGGSSTRDGVQHATADRWGEAMGIDWMTSRGLAQAIPPAYTQWIVGRSRPYSHRPAPGMWRARQR